jgi:8-oxo-dGTP diphosphatase
MKVIEVAAGLVFRDGQLLITQRRPQDHLGGLWEFPGGKREPVETFEQCLRRELLEELGVDVTVGKLVDEISHTYPEKSVHLKFYRCTLTSGEPQPIHCHALAWVNQKQLRDYEFPAADIQLLAMLERDGTIWQA